MALTLVSAGTPMLTHCLWSTIDPTLAHEILTQAQTTDKKLYKKVLDTMSSIIGLRSVKILEQPKIERHAQWSELLARPELEPLSLHLFTHWLMTTQTPMFLVWLDAIGAAHDHGLIETFPPCPPAATLQKGLDALLAQFPAPKVLIYLTAFNQADEAQWAPLDDLLAAEPRLKLTP